MICHIHSKNTELEKKQIIVTHWSFYVLWGFLHHKLYMKPKIMSNTKKFNIKKTKDI
jgi:hypothetical protein